MMKHRIIISAMLVLPLLLANSCRRGDGDADYGNSYIYMPQATVNAGLDNHYNVPSGGAENTLNFEVSETDVEIYMGVLLSGKAESKGFSVNIVVDEAKTGDAAASLGAAVLPDSVYELPPYVDVAEGKNSEIFHLLVKKDFVAAAEGKYVLVVGLADPSEYELSPNATSVTVVIDADALQKYI